MIHLAEKPATRRSDLLATTCPESLANGISAGSIYTDSIGRALAAALMHLQGVLRSPMGHYRGGKNSLFIGIPRGGWAAVLSSVTSTCRRHNIDPQLYLTSLQTDLSQIQIGLLRQGTDGPQCLHN